MIRIFSVKLTENDSDPLTKNEREKARKRQMEKLQDQINELVDKVYPDVEVTWLQSSFTNDGYGFTRITATVKY